jgi:hypothetical protein
MTYLGRDIATVFHEALKQLPVVVLTGLRQTGKSTFLLNDPALKNYTFETLDDLGSLDAARRDPVGFIAGRDRFIIDEAQRCPDLMIALKAEIDRDRRPGRFVLSGSARFSLLAEISESLAGRSLYLTLSPLTRRELDPTRGDRSFLARLLSGDEIMATGTGPAVAWDEVLRGGFPPVVMEASARPEFWFKGYEQTYIERDVRRFSEISDMISFRRLLQMSALRSAQVLNRSELARDAGLKVATASRYLSIMETSFVTTTLSPYITNRTSRLIKSPKVFITDSGFACHLAGVSPSSNAVPESLRGALFETFVFQNLSGILASIRPDTAIHFWNIQGRHEVDFIIESAGEVIPIEVKNSARWKDADISGLRAFIAHEPRCRTAILAYNGGGARPIMLDEKIIAVPVGTLLS